MYIIYSFITAKSYEMGKEMGYCLHLYSKTLSSHYWKKIATNRVPSACLDLNSSLFPGIQVKIPGKSYKFWGLKTEFQGLAWATTFFTFYIITCPILWNVINTLSSVDLQDIGHGKFHSGIPIFLWHSSEIKGFMQQKLYIQIFIQESRKSRIH